MDNQAMRNLPRGTRVLVAMSGGVDSSVAAYRLVQAGFEVVGVTMNLVPEEDRLNSASEYAGKAAAHLGIPNYTHNMADIFKEKVIRPTRDEYARGRTPNPCILCNRYMKFDILFNRAKELGCTHIATGHYCRIQLEPSGYHLLRGVDPEKDQSYFLAFLTEGELERIIFPLGENTKESVRKEAANAGLEIADRPESQDLCFFASRSGDNSPDELSNVGKPGDIVTTDGIVVGRHTGIGAFTRGQRKGIPGGMPQRMYVVDIDPETNRVIIGTEDECYSSDFTIEDVSLVSRERDIERMNENVEIQVRYRTRPIAGRICLTKNMTGSVSLDEPVKAITPGQATVFYSGDVVLGTGTISSVERK